MKLFKTHLVSSLNVTGNSGNDIVGFKSSQIDGTTTIDLGSGDDAMLSEGNKFGNVTRLGGSQTSWDFSEAASETLMGTSQLSGFEMWGTGPSDISDSFWDQLI